MRSLKLPQSSCPNFQQMSIYRRRGFFFFFFLSSSSKFPPWPCLNHPCKNAKNVCILKKEKGPFSSARLLLSCWCWLDVSAASELAQSASLMGWRRASNCADRFVCWLPTFTATCCVWILCLNPDCASLKRHICSRFGVYCSRFSWERSRNELFSGFFFFFFGLGCCRIKTTHGVMETSDVWAHAVWGEGRLYKALCISLNCVFSNANRSNKMQAWLFFLEGRKRKTCLLYCMAGCHMSFHPVLFHAIFFFWWFRKWGAEELPAVCVCVLVCVKAELKPTASASSDLMQKAAWSALLCVPSPPSIQQLCSFLSLSTLSRFADYHEVGEGRGWGVSLGCRNVTCTDGLKPE